MISCILCKGHNLDNKYLFNELTYFCCLNCGLIFLDPDKRLSLEEERSRYELHQNNPNDQGYRNFLGKAVSPLSLHIDSSMTGLDYGCGSGPTISCILGEKRIKVENYDPYFFPKIFKESDQYDFITCTETIEHFHSPEKEFNKLSKLLRPGGWLALMTEVYDPNLNFSDWWYLREPTHVSIYQSQTFNWIADHYRWKMDTPHKNVRIYQS